MRPLVIAIALMLATACVHHAPKPKETSYVDFLSANLANLQRLSVGMTREQVQQTMGSEPANTRNGDVPNPFEVDRLDVKGESYEILYYLTKKYPPFTPVKRSQATPLVMKGGMLIGWGQGALDALGAEINDRSR